jgi:plasmid stability protein
MASILVRRLDEGTVQRLKERARLNGRSLLQEVKEILKRAASTLTISEARRLAERWRHRLGGRSRFAMIVASVSRREVMVRRGATC